VFLCIRFLRISVSKKSQIWNLTKIRPVGVVDPWGWGGRRKVGTSKRGCATRIAVWLFEVTERSQRQPLRVSRDAAHWVHVWVCQNLFWKIEFGCGCKHRSMNTVASGRQFFVSFGCRLFPLGVRELAFGNSVTLPQWLVTQITLRTASKNSYNTGAS
jgi:hypothetical protein